jgi:glycerophosphoryl diester phosphodiesterase
LVTFEEFLQFTRAQEKKRGKIIGIIPEIKHSSYFHSLGFDPEQGLVDLLKKYDFDTATEPVIIQSLEVDNLKRLRKMTKVELVQLIDDPELVPGDAQVAHRAQHFSDLATKEGLAQIAEYADWVSPDKAYIYPRDKANCIDKPSSFVEDAHRVGLKVLPWTFRKEGKFLPEGMDLRAELLLYYKQGVDGVFTDFADIAVQVRALFWGRAVRR